MGTFTADDVCFAVFNTTYTSPAAHATVATNASASATTAAPAATLSMAKCAVSYMFVRYTSDAAAFNAVLTTFHGTDRLQPPRCSCGDDSHSSSSSSSTSTSSDSYMDEIFSLSALPLFCEAPEAEPEAEAEAGVGPESDVGDSSASCSSCDAVEAQAQAQAQRIVAAMAGASWRSNIWGLPRFIVGHQQQQQSALAAALTDSAPSTVLQRMQHCFASSITGAGGMFSATLNGSYAPRTAFLILLLQLLRIMDRTASSSPLNTTGTSHSRVGMSWAERTSRRVFAACGQLQQLLPLHQQAIANVEVSVHEDCASWTALLHARALLPYECFLAAVQLQNLSKLD